MAFIWIRARLALLLAVTSLVVLGLARFARFRDDTNLIDDVLDALAALLVAFVVSGVLLVLFGLVGPNTAVREGVGMLAVQASPASMGAILANKQLQARSSGRSKEDRAGYLGQLFLMAAGALLLAFNVAPRVLGLGGRSVNEKASGGRVPRSPP